MTWNPPRCKNCGRTCYEWKAGVFIHHHNGVPECFPNLVAEVDERDYGEVEPEPELSRTA